MDRCPIGSGTPWPCGPLAFAESEIDVRSGLLLIEGDFFDELGPPGMKRDFVFWATAEAWSGLPCCPRLRRQGV